MENASGDERREEILHTQGVVQPVLDEFAASLDGNIINPLTSASGESSATESPMERLIRAIKSCPPEALASAATDITSVERMVDRTAGSAPGNGSRASVGGDLAATTKTARLQERNVIMTQERMMPTKKMKRDIIAMPISVGDKYKQFAGSETSDLEITGTSDGRKARTESKNALLKEIEEINQRLVDTVVKICDDKDAADPSEGTIVKFAFVPVSLSPDLMDHLLDRQMLPIQPLRLLVPCSYPSVSPSILDNFPFETSKENEDLSSKAMERFNRILRTLSEPMSLKGIAVKWGVCVREVILEYVTPYGGGTFSSKYGGWTEFVPRS